MGSNVKAKQKNEWKQVDRGPFKFVLTFNADDDDDDND